jgi:hypothetical protein
MYNLTTLALKQINSKDSYESIKLILNHKDFPSIERVKFAYNCAKDLDKFYNVEKYPEVKKTRNNCLELIADYILNPNSKNIKKLERAADAAYAAANAAYAAAYAAANAANAAANAAYAAAYAANAANAANAADAAAYAAANAANAVNAANAAYAAAYAAANAANAAANVANAAYAAAYVANAANAAAYAANAAYAAAYVANAAAYLKELLIKLIIQVLGFTGCNKLPKLFYL